MTSAYILEQIANGIILGSLYALVAIGFSMIYGIVRLINFAHGDIVMIGAFATLGRRRPQRTFCAGGDHRAERRVPAGMRSSDRVSADARGAAGDRLHRLAGGGDHHRERGIMTLTAQPRNFIVPDLAQHLRSRRADRRSAPSSSTIVVLAILLMAALALFVRSPRSAWRCGRRPRTSMSRG